MSVVIVGYNATLPPMTNDAPSMIPYIHIEFYLSTIFYAGRILYVVNALPTPIYFRVRCLLLWSLHLTHIQFGFFFLTYNRLVIFSFFLSDVPLLLGVILHLK